MMGYDMSWAAFNIVELLSTNKYSLKRIAYAGAAQSFHDGTEVALLTTNFFKKVKRNYLHLKTNNM